VPINNRISSVARRLGLEGVVLLAALLCDLLIIFPAAFDDVGPNGRDLLLLPGILALFGCALWGRTRPTAAAFAGAAALVGSTLLIRGTDASAYSTLLSNISLSETVAGLELVLFCVRRARPSRAFLAVSALVIAALFAAVIRGEPGGSQLETSLFTGAVLLGVCVAWGGYLRRISRGGRAPRPDVTRPVPPAIDLVRRQWMLIGSFSLPLFLELSQTLDKGPRAIPLFLCSVAAAMAAVAASWKPVQSGIALAGVVLITVPAYQLAPRSFNLPEDALPSTEIFAGVVAVVFLIRYAKRNSAWWTIGLLSLAVAITTVFNLERSRGYASDARLRTLFMAAVLILGMAVAVGLYLRARDSERSRVVEAAVTEAQTSERMALARELHDVVAHHVTGIVVQAQAAKMIGAQNPALAVETLGRIEQAGTDALTAMRRLVRSMRGSAEVAEHATTDLADDLRRLAEAEHHGVATEVEVRLSAEIPQEVGRSALRLVQESLTNVGKHAAGASKVLVRAETVEGELHIRVTNDGQPGEGTPPGGSGGYGLVGMRERVELLHGRLIAGPVQEGWLVEAWLPLAESAPE
jgi:signal transduction histidine kinase